MLNDFYFIKICQDVNNYDVVILISYLIVILNFSKYLA